MRKKRLLSTIILVAACLLSQAQPSQVKNVAKSVFTLTTFRADGSLLASSHGVFTGQPGEAISDLKPFLGAATAVVVDQRGNKMNVSHMLGVNDIYDVAHFRVDGKTTPAPLATSAKTTGAKAWLVGYALKNLAIKETTVKSMEPFMEKYAYYLFSIDAPDNTTSCPFVNENGEVMGLMQVSNTTYDIHATDARYIASLSLNALSYNNSTMRQIGIPIALPTDQEQAQIALMMAAQSGDSLKYVAAISDFTSLFPTLRDGYEAQARQYMAQDRFADAEATMQQALKMVTNKDEVHYDYSKIIYDKELYRHNVPFEPWNIDKALGEAQQAYELNPLPLYQHLQAQIVFSKGDYQQALGIFQSLSNHKDFSTPELLYEQAQCHTMLGTEPNKIIELLDSAINTTDTLRITEAAPYFLARAAAYEQTDSFRQAVFDYTRYEILMQGRVNANFYYTRSQAEVKGRLYQQALTDMARAIILAPQEPGYYAEMAQLQLRVNQIDNALQTAERCTVIAPDYPEGWLLLGLAQVRNGEKEAGLQSMRKAKELGSEQADALIQKYQ